MLLALIVVCITIVAVASLRFAQWLIAQERATDEAADGLRERRWALMIEAAKQHDKESRRLEAAGDVDGACKCLTSP